MKKTLLVVDEDASVRASLRKVLAEAGYQVHTAASGEEARRQFDSRTIHLLILDPTFPDESGWDIFEHLTSANPFLPVIIITSQTGAYDLALAAGAGGLIEKPVDALHLLQIVRNLLAEPREVRLRRLCGREENLTHAAPASTQLLRTLREQMVHERPLLAYAIARRWGQRPD